MKLEDLKHIENLIMGGLKDFQRATVDRVCTLFESGQKRILVADEVGLGKTLVAKGVIARTARFHKENNDDLFKVVYICSNQNIAKQNITKLKIDEDITIDGVTDTRLSMQHLKIFEQENSRDIKDKYVQLIPLTPGTSFSITSGCGTVQERALMFAILRRLPFFKDYTDELENIFIDYAQKSWEWANKAYEERVVLCDKDSGGRYLKTLIKAINEYFKGKAIHEELINLCREIRQSKGARPRGTSRMVHKFRTMFAYISTGLLQADLVIMDEFQRFRYLISADKETETRILADRFLHANSVKVLLLSATPYKLYSTLDEINEMKEDEHYTEFFEIIDFLFDKPDEQKRFREIWSNFSIKLREMCYGDVSIIEAKNQAEDSMYKGVCRTERMAAVETGDFIEDKIEPVKISEKDVLSYIESEELLKEMGQRYSVPVEYVKSAPYILSFMRDYKLKKNIEKYFMDRPDEVRKLNKSHLWIRSDVIQNYRELEHTNARLEKLYSEAFENGAEMLLWIPPSKPYYEPQGVFEKAGGFSKILVFSAWEMVPRMIATLVSYEAERRTIGNLIEKRGGRSKLKDAGYFARSNTRFPVGRLRFRLSEQEPAAMSLFCLMYPSKTLADIYNPIECLNKGMKLEDIEKEIGKKVSELLDRIKVFEGEGRRDDNRWYYIAPMLFDDRGYAEEWIGNGNALVQSEMDGDLVGLDEEEDKGQKAFMQHLNRLELYLREVTSQKLRLGRRPDDLAEVLTNMALASPAVCAYRANGGNGLHASQFAKIMLNRLNLPESTAIIEHCYGEASDDAHWRNVLRYFKDGNFQAVLDEYVHILCDMVAPHEKVNKHEFIHTYMLEAMSTHSASYTIDTYDTFRKSITKGKSRGISMRSHYAVGFQGGDGESSKQVIRKESIRASFNSPFRPFVLATTSIGQEGLDFHCYCRKIMHWNLPSNPVDLEQREGRVNRFKCLAIRQNIACMYGEIKFHSDIWSEMFEAARNHYSKEHSELIPFWCLPGKQEFEIERIVPVYPVSKDIGKYGRLIKILSLYRLTLGQARQEELLEHIFKNQKDTDIFKDLFINLSPYYKATSDALEI